MKDAKTFRQLSWVYLALGLVMTVLGAINRELGWVFGSIVFLGGSVAYGIASSIIAAIDRAADAVNPRAYTFVVGGCGDGS